jgi:TPR repeat protein
MDNAVEGLRLLERAAALGDANAALAAAIAYATGDRVEKDGQKAMGLLERDALFDNALALAWKGWLWQNGWAPSQTTIGRIENQIRELHAESDGLLHQARELVGKNDKFDQLSALNNKSLELLTKISALRSETEAQIDLDKAAHCFTKNLAIAYIRESAVNLGILDLLGSKAAYLQKAYIARPDVGFGLLERPAREGNSDALFFRAFALERGIGVQRDVAAAREIYGKPELENYSRAQIALRRTETSVSKILADENKDLSALIDKRRVGIIEEPDYTRNLSDFSVTYKANTDFQTVELRNRNDQRVFWAQLRKGQSVALNPNSPEIIYLSNIWHEVDVVGYIRNGQTEQEVHSTKSSLQVDPADFLRFPTATSHPNKDSDWTVETPRSVVDVTLHNPAYRLSNHLIQFAPDKDHSSDDYDEPYPIPVGPDIILEFEVVRGSCFGFRASLYSKGASPAVVC